MMVWIQTVFADQVDLDKQTDNFTEHDIRKYEACEI